MKELSVKEKIIETVQDLPEDATVEDAMERLYFLLKIERGLSESDRDQTIGHDEVKRRFAK